MNSTLKEVVGGILERARDQRRNSDSYKELIDLNEREGLAIMLREANNKLVSLTLDIVQVLRDTHGEVPLEVYEMIEALPLIRDKFEQLVIEEQGHSVDASPKSFRRIATTMLCLIADKKKLTQSSPAL